MGKILPIVVILLFIGLALAPSINAKIQLNTDESDHEPFFQDKSFVIIIAKGETKEFNPIWGIGALLDFQGFDDLANLFYKISQQKRFGYWNWIHLKNNITLLSVSQDGKISRECYIINIFDFYGIIFKNRAVGKIYIGYVRALNGWFNI